MIPGKKGAEGSTRAATGPTMTRPVTVAEYRSAEQAAQSKLSVPVLMAFQPVTYLSVGFPVQVEMEEELVRYVDHNFEVEVPRLYRLGASFTPIGYVNAFTTDEAALAQRIRALVADVTDERFGRRTQPMTNLLVQFGPYRAMEAIAAAYGVPHLNVFEPGPGLAYLGALLSLQGHRYCCFDVTQALYLWQSHLLNAVAGEDFADYAHTENLDDLGQARITHLPWWRFAEQLSGTPLRCDIVYSNSNLGEMTLVSLKHLLHISRKMLADSPIGAFMYFSPGMLAQNTEEGLRAEFSQFGFARVMESPFICYMPKDRDPRPLVQAFGNGIPFYNPSDDDERIDASTLVTTPRAEAPLDALLTQWCFGWEAPLI